MPTCSFDDDHCDREVDADGELCAEHAARAESLDWESAERHIDFCESLGIEP